MNQKPIAQCRTARQKRSHSPVAARKAPKPYKVTPPTDEHFIETNAKSNKKRWTLWVYGGQRNPAHDGWTRSETTWEKMCRLKHKTDNLEI